MPRKAHGRPPLPEWERQKDVILSLVSQYPWPVVIERMRKEHNFSASNEHYVAQMKAWGTRKYLKKYEWRGVLRKYDELEARHDSKIQMRFLGEVVPEERIKRARKQLRLQANQDVPGVNNPCSIPTHASFEVLGANGAWSVCTDEHHDFVTSSPNTSAQPFGFSTPSVQSPTAGHFLSNAAEGNSATYTEQQLNSIAPASINPIDSLTLALPSTFASNRQDTSWPMWNSMSVFTPEPRPDMEDLPSFDFPGMVNQNEPFDLIHQTSMLTGISSVVSPRDAFQGFDPGSLIDLPFHTFQMSVAIRGIDLRDLRPQIMAMQCYRASVLAKAFLRDVADAEFSLSNMPGPKASPRDIQPGDLLASFHSILPGEAAAYQTDLITKDAMLDTNFTRLLVFSTTNGFAGLGDIPVASVLRFLTRYGNINALFERVLSASPSHVAKSLAENLVKVAIEARQAQVVKYLLESQLLQVNDLVCEGEGQKLTALERAAQLRDHKTVEVLLAVNADVRKSYASEATDCGPLNHLINYSTRGETFSSDAMALVDTLLAAGAETDAEMLERVIRNTRNSTVALCFITSFLQTHKEECFITRVLGPYKAHLLPLVALELEEAQAYEGTEQIIGACERLHNGTCLQKPESKVEWAVVQSVKRGHIRVAQLLLPYTDKLSRVLSAAFHSGKSEIVEMILAKCPDFHAPAFSLVVEKEEADLVEYMWTLTTPFAEAIRTRNSTWIHSCEASGALRHLYLEGHFNAALAAAACVGDLEYVQKLFRNRLEPLPQEMYVALVFSIENGHDDISALLIDAGTQLQDDLFEYYGRPTPLIAAVRKRNASMVRAILDSGDIHILAGYSTVREDISEWGDRSIILDYHHAFPRAKLLFKVVDKTRNVVIAMDRLIKGVMEKGLLTFLMDHNLVHESAFPYLLKTAIQKSDTAMIYYLIDLGASPSDLDNLCVAVKNPSRPDILVLLLDHIPRRARIVPGLGTRAIKKAIKLGLPGLKMVDILLASGVVDIHSCCGGSLTVMSPLGIAIRMAGVFAGDYIIVRRMLKAGCDPNSVVIGHRDHNLTAILVAIQTKSVGLVKLLLDHGAEVNAPAIRRLLRTPLQAAAESGCLEVVQLLLENGADVDGLPAKRGGGTALQFAAISGNCNIAAELLKRNANPMMPPSSVRGRWPLEGAAEHGRIDMIAFLLRLKVYDNDHCRRAAKFAQENGHMGCVDLIQEHISQHEEMPLLDAFDIGAEFDWMT